jgi:hypothetical protein
MWPLHSTSGSHGVTNLCGSRLAAAPVLFGNSLLDETNDDHEDTATYPTASHLTDQATDIKTARLGASCRCAGTEDT